MKLTPHFTFEELTATNCTSLQKMNRDKADKEPVLMMYLAIFAEQIRRVLGVPVRVTSGYRCAELNKQVGGVSTSQHVLFQALDIIPVGMELKDAYNKLVKSDMLFGQLILENNKWLHVSIGFNRETLVFKDGVYKKFIGE